MIKLSAALAMISGIDIVGAESYIPGFWASVPSPAKKMTVFWEVSSVAPQAYCPKATSDTSFVVSE